MEDEKIYYIQDSRSYTGNCMMWWGKNSKGYTTNLDNAQLYSQSEAREICERETDKAYHKDYVEQHVQRTVDCQYIDKNMIVKFEPEAK